MGILYRNETNRYCTDLERVSAHDIPKQMDKMNPEAGKEAVGQMLESAQSSVRKMEEARRALSYYASVLDRLTKDYPDVVTRLSEEEQALVREIANRLTPEELHSAPKNADNGNISSFEEKILGE